MGYNSGAITECWASVTVISEGDNVGGLVGENLPEGIITEAYSEGIVTLTITVADWWDLTVVKSLVLFPCTVNGDRRWHSCRQISSDSCRKLYMVWL